jgi:hypothetical protein
MNMSASGEEDVLRYKHNTKMNSGMSSYLGRRCRVGLRQARPDLSSRPSYGKEARTGAKAAMPAFNKSSSSRACDISITKRIRRWSGGGGRERGAGGGGGGGNEE